MRVVGGRLGGRTLRAPATREIRPTSDRLRETIFNVLAHGYDDRCRDARVVDLFAGTGALGIEAMSRGAAFTLFVDDGSGARALLRENIETLGLGGVTRIFRRDATKLGEAPAGMPFTLAFLDPPYGRELAPRALQALHDGKWLAMDALCIVEDAAGVTVDLPPAFTPMDRRTSGDTQILFATYIGDTAVGRNR